MRFKEKVLNVVKRIKKGKILSYKKVAKLAGSPKAYRAVGNVLNKNQDPYLPKFSKKTLAGKQIPCHRVIRSDGKIGGYNKGVGENGFTKKRRCDNRRRGKEWKRKVLHAKRSIFFKQALTRCV